MIIVVSDVHLGYEESDDDAFEDFVNKYVSKELKSKDHFVLLVISLISGEERIWTLSLKMKKF